MTTASGAGSPHPVQLVSRSAFVLILVGNGIRLSSGARTSPFDVVMWTTLVVLAVYIGLVVASTLTHRPLTRRRSMQAEGVGLLAILVVAAWAVSAAAWSHDWASVTSSGIALAVNGLLLWIVARQLRGGPADPAADRAGA